MADKKISELTSRVTLAGTDIFPVVDSGATYKATLAANAEYVRGLLDSDTAQAVLENNNIISLRDSGVNKKTTMLGIRQYIIGSNKDLWIGDFPKVKSSTARTVIVTPENMAVEINGVIFSKEDKTEIDINIGSNWDESTYATAGNRIGKDFYVYALSSATNTPDFLISIHSDYPVGYSASNSKKIGGFHCLCVSASSVYSYVNEGKDPDYLDAIYSDGSSIVVGNTAHWLSGFIAGDILPFSCWGLNHRPALNCDVEGRVYDPKSNKWVMIYLPSWDATAQKLVSVYGGTIADGASTPKFHWYRFSQVLMNQGEEMPHQAEFISYSLGSPQGVAINGAADPNTTGGHVATNSQRILSNIGVEDATGVLWQWGKESGANTTTAYADAYDANDKNVGGQEYSTITRPLFGGGWASGVSCGSRASGWHNGGLFLLDGFASRGVAEPIK